MPETSLNGMQPEFEPSWFNQLIEGLPDALLLVDPGGRIVLANPQAERTFGYQPGALAGQTIEALIPQHRAAAHAAHRKQYAQAPKARRMGTGLELAARKQDGSEFPAEVSLNPIGGPEKLLVCAVIRDLTERKAAEAHMADRAAVLTALVDSIPYPLIVKDAAGRFLSCNRAYEQAFAATREAIRGKTVLDVDHIPAEDRRRFHERGLEVIAGALHRTMELPIRYADGEMRVVLYSPDGFRLSDGRPGGLIGLLVDITDRKKAQHKLAEEEERSRLILESTAEGLFGVDRNGLLTFVNPAATSMLGYTAEELIGRRSHQLLHDRRPDGTPYPEHECPMYAAYARGETRRVDDELLWCKDGRGVPVEYRATPIRKDGEISGAVISFADISDRRVRDDAFRAVWNMPGEGVLPFDENGLSAVNETWLRTMGYDHAEEILGKMPYEFAPERKPDGSSSIDTLRAAAANTAAEGRLDPAAARMALERLVRVVEDFDASSAAAALAEVVAMKWSGEESDLIMQLRNQVDTYEFDDAAATAARLIERLGRLPF